MDKWRFKGGKKCSAMNISRIEYISSSEQLQNNKQYISGIMIFYKQTNKIICWVKKQNETYWEHVLLLAELWMYNKKRVNTHSGRKTILLIYKQCQFHSFILWNNWSCFHCQVAHSNFRLGPVNRLLPAFSSVTLRERIYPHQKVNEMQPLPVRTCMNQTPRCTLTNAHSRLLSRHRALW